MTDTLKFGFEKTRMCLDVPQAIMNDAVDKGDYLGRILRFAQPKDRVVISKPIEEGRRLIFSTRRAGNLPDKYKRDRCKQMVIAINEVVQAAPDNLQDPSLALELGDDYINDGDRFGFNAYVKWPDADLVAVQDIATKAMHRTAKDLKYAQGCNLNGMVYAQLSRQYGVTLETNSIASASLDTDGTSYNPEDSVINLSAHNMYSHEMQLVCLSGLIAIARS